MKYTPKLAPEEINVPKTSHLKEFVILASSLVGLILISVFILAVLADTLVKYIPIDAERNLFSFGKQMMPVPEDPTTDQSEVQLYIAGIVEKMRTEKSHQFTISILESKTPNAFAFPGDQIAITRGLLGKVDSENGLAMVIAHEMAHQYKRHPIRAMGRGIIVMIALSTLFGIEDSGPLQSLVNNTVNLNILSFSREQEREADAMGLDLLKQTYGHAKGANEFFISMQEDAGKADIIPGFLSTHPSPQQRLDFLSQTNGFSDNAILTPLPAFVKNYAKFDE